MELTFMEPLLTHRSLITHYQFVYNMVEIHENRGEIKENILFFIYFIEV